jgi:hypothetical protein
MYERTSRATTNCSTFSSSGFVAESSAVKPTSQLAKSGVGVEKVTVIGGGMAGRTW